MKRVVAFVLAILTILCLTACGIISKNAEKSVSELEPSIKTTETPLSSEVSPEISAEDSESFQPLEVKEFGYSVDGEYLYYSIDLYNPNSQYIVEFPAYRITARDANGGILGSTDETLMEIYPGQDVWHAFMAFSIEEEPKTVDVDILPPEDYQIVRISVADHKEYIALEVINTAIRDDTFGKKIVGEIKNNNDYNIESAAVTVVFRDENGVLLGGDTTFVDFIPAGSSTPFELSVYNDFVTDIFEAYASPW